jgi:hypothetical protein
MLKLSSLMTGPSPVASELCDPFLASTPLHIKPDSFLVLALHSDISKGLLRHNPDRQSRLCLGLDTVLECLPRHPSELDRSDAPGMHKDGMMRTQDDGTASSALSVHVADISKQCVRCTNECKKKERRKVASMKFSRRVSAYISRNASSARQPQL